MSSKYERVEQKVESLTEKVEILKRHQFSDPENSTTATQVLDSVIAGLEEFLEIVENDEQHAEITSSAHEMALDN